MFRGTFETFCLKRFSYDFAKGLAKTGRVTILSLGRFRGRCFLIPKFSGKLFFTNNHQILEIKCEELSSENGREVKRKTQALLIGYMNGRGYPEIVSLYYTLEIVKQC